MIDSENKRFELTFLLRVLRRFGLLIVVISFIGMALGIVFSVWGVKPRYKATALIFAWADVEKEENTAVDGDKSAEVIANEPAGKAAATHQDSERLRQERALSKLRGFQMLTQQLTIGNLLMPDFQALLSSRKLRGKIDDELRRKFPGRPLEKYTLSAKPLPRTRFVEVSVYCRSKDMAPQIVNTVVNIFSNEARELLGVNNTQVIDCAQTAQKISPHPLSCAFIGFLIGLAGSVALAFCIEFFDKSIRDIKDLENDFKLPVLGVLPEVNSPGGNTLWALNAKSSYGEAIRSLRVNVEYLLPETGRAKIFLISSVSKSEGKSSVMANLSLAVAQIEKRALLVDMDLRRPLQHRIFKLSNKAGLVDMLVSKNKFEDLVCRDVKVKGLDVLCCGTVPMNPTDLLGSRKLEDFLREQSGNYDYIFLDAPPTLGFADPLILGNLADSTIITCDYRTTNTDKLRMTMESFRKANIKVGGLVINRFQMQNRNDYYYNYQHYYYQYIPDDGSDDTHTDVTVES